MMADWLSYSNQGATRNQPLSQRLVDAFSFLPELGVTMDVYSGGQPSEGPNRVGSVRHDHGNSGDVTFRHGGRMLDWNNPADMGMITDIVARARSAGVTGIGAGDDYMGAGRFHVGFGAPAVWGAGGKAANAPQWLRDAYYKGQVPPNAVAAINAAAPPALAPKPAAMGYAQAGGVMRPGKAPAQAGGPPPSMGTLSGRTAIMRAAMAGNIGKSAVTPGSEGKGVGALAIGPGGSSRVMISSPSRGGNEVYRENAKILGPGGFTQDNINRALAAGHTLFKPLMRSGRGSSGGDRYSVSASLSGGNGP